MEETKRGSDDGAEYGARGNVDAANEEDRNVKMNIYNEFNVPILKEIDSYEGIDQNKIDRTEKKAAEYVQKLEETVKSYLKKAGMDDFSVDPEIKLNQINKAERQLMKIAKYLSSEILENDDLDKDKLSYVEILQNVKDTQSNSVDEAILCENKKNVEYSILRNKHDDLKTKRNVAMKLMNELENECLKHKESNQITEEAAVNKCKDYEELLVSIHKLINSKIKGIEINIKNDQHPSYQ